MTKAHWLNQAIEEAEYIETGDLTATARAYLEHDLALIHQALTDDGLAKSTEVWQACTRLSFMHASVRAQKGDKAWFEREMKRMISERQH